MMKKLLATLCVSVCFAGLASGSLVAQQSTVNSSRTQVAGIRTAAPEGIIKINDSEKKSNSSVQSVSGTPLKLRNGAVPTGLQGYYDYQSNGGSPSYIQNKGNTIHTCYMLSTSKGDNDTAVLSSNRRVGYAVSTDNGVTWKSTKQIENIRRGFPWLTLNSDGEVVIATHGATTTNSVIRTFLYYGSGGTDFIVANEFPAENANGSVGSTSGSSSGVIWPCVVASPKKKTDALVFGSIGPDQVANREQLNVSIVEVGGAATPTWKNIREDETAKTSGGNYAVATSAGGKIGVTWEYVDVNANFENSGIYFSESKDGGVSWSEPVKAIGFNVHNLTNENGDEDTLNYDGIIDIAYVGEEANIVSAGSINNLYVSRSIFHWTPSRGFKVLATTDVTKGLGVSRFAANKSQPNTGFLNYPTLSVTPDGKNVVVAFQAWATTDETGTTIVSSEEGFPYSRLWAIGSKDGGKNWGTPILIQDFAGNGTDSASCEYPSLSPVCTNSNGATSCNLVFQARRNPGAYAFVASFDADGDGQLDTQVDRPSDFSECFQYFQKISIPDNNAGSVEKEESSASALGLKAFPNPTNGKTTLQYTLPTSGEVLIKLFNTLGAEVYTIKNAKAFAGTYSDEINFENLPAGTYRCVINQNGVFANRMIHVVK